MSGCAGPFAAAEADRGRGTVSYRLSVVLPVTLGLYLMCLGAVLLVDSTGTRSLGISGVAGAAIGLALVAMGVLTALAAWRARRFTRRLRRAIGHLRSSEQGWRVDDAVISTVLGDISLDFRGTDLPQGETELTLLCWLGTLQVVVPREFAVSVSAQALVGTVEALGRREEGLMRDIDVRTHGYEQAARRLHLQVSTLVGEARVTRATD